MNGKWSLDALYKGYDDPRYSEDLKRFNELIEELKVLADSPDEGLVRRYIELSEDIAEHAEKLMIFSMLKRSVNTQDAEATAQAGRLMAKFSQMAAPNAQLSMRIAKLENLDELIESDPLLSEYSYMLKNIREDSKYLLEPREERIVSEMNISGGDTWSQLQEHMTSTLPINYRGETITLSAVRNLAYDPDPAVRKDAYEAEIAAYERVKDSVAFALNSIKLETINTSRLRGYESPLARTLYNARMKRETLDALIGAMTDYLPKFHEYLKAKGRALGHENGLPWYDLFAPMGKSDKKYTIEEAKVVLLDMFDRFDSELANMVRTAFADNWIDFFPGEGKVGGAFCCPIQSIKQSRVLTNFDGSFSDIVTLAHELGHAFHNLNLYSHRPLNTDYSMPVAETASTFNEVVLMDKAIKASTDKQEKLALIEGQLCDANQIICDILSRYLFETSVFESREDEFLFPDKLCELMLAAQQKAYGDGLDPNCKHPYMWLCKGHYYSTSTSFYNFPYAFGGLFARGLYAKYLQEGESFVAKYKELLHATTVMSCEDTAMIAGIDLTDKAFWTMGLQTIADEIDEFIQLVEE